MTRMANDDNARDDVGHSDSFVMMLVIRIHSGQAKSRMKCAHGAVANADGSRLVVQAGIIFKASGGLPDSLVRPTWLHPQRPQGGTLQA